MPMQLAHEDNNEILTSDKGFTKPGRFLFGDMFSAFCRNTRFSFSKFDSLSSILQNRNFIKIYYKYIVSTSKISFGGRFNDITTSRKSSIE